MLLECSHHGRRHSHAASTSATISWIAKRAKQCIIEAVIIIHFCSTRDHGRIELERERDGFSLDSVGRDVGARRRRRRQVAAKERRRRQRKPRRIVFARSSDRATVCRKVSKAKL